MPKKKLILCVVAVLGLGGLCLYVNRDYFSTQPIQISHRISPVTGRPRARQPVTDLGALVVFSFNTYYRFTDIKVFMAAEIETNKYAHAIWNMVTDSNSIPMASFAYGSYLRGMRPAVKGEKPDPLEPGVKYRLIVKTADGEAHHDFTTDLPRR
ncbi:MAG: hypothetical protein MUF81_08450 [Verrucomicrobia bacterium]|jgi:hypothetical protein|nr:hypothetical protein [Verrucomicrobiota bacterium]